MRIPSILLSILMTSTTLVVAHPAAAAQGDTSENTNTVCWITPGTPHIEEGAACTRGTITGSSIGCEYDDSAPPTWGCSIRATAADIQDPGTCGHTSVLLGATTIANSRGCGGFDLGKDPFGHPIVGTPVPVTGETPWIRAEKDDLTGTWYVKLLGEVAVYDPAGLMTSLPFLSDQFRKQWDVLIEVPPPTTSPSCPASGTSAGMSLGLGGISATAEVPILGVSVEETISSGWTTTSTDPGSTGQAKVYADSGDVGC